MSVRWKSDTGEIKARGDKEYGVSHLLAVEWTEIISVHQTF